MAQEIQVSETFGEDGHLRCCRPRVHFSVKGESAHANDATVITSDIRASN
jgi:hypothetical protein